MVTDLCAVGGSDGCRGMVGVHLALLQLFLHEDQLLLVLLVLLCSENWTRMETQLKCVKARGTVATRAYCQTRYSPLKDVSYHLSNDVTKICELDEKTTSYHLST